MARNDDYLYLRAYLLTARVRHCQVRIKLNEARKDGAPETAIYKQGSKWVTYEDMPEGKHKQVIRDWVNRYLELQE